MSNEPPWQGHRKLPAPLLYDERAPQVRAVDVVRDDICLRQASDVDDHGRGPVTQPSVTSRWSGTSCGSPTSKPSSAPADAQASERSVGGTMSGSSWGGVLARKNGTAANPATGIAHQRRDQGADAGKRSQHEASAGELGRAGAWSHRPRRQTAGLARRCPLRPARAWAALPGPWSAQAMARDGDGADPSGGRPRGPRGRGRKRYGSVTSTQPL